MSTIEHIFGGTLRSTRSVSVQSSPTSIQLGLGAASAVLLTNTNLSGLSIELRLPLESQSQGDQKWIYAGPGSTGAILVQGAAGAICTLGPAQSALVACDGNAWYLLGGLEGPGRELQHQVEIPAGDTTALVEVPSPLTGPSGAILVTLEAPAAVTFGGPPVIRGRTPGVSFSLEVNATNTSGGPAQLTVNAKI